MMTATGDTQMSNKDANEVTELALRMHAAILASLTEEEKARMIVLDEAMWLTMLMICGPHRAAYMVSQCRI